MAYPTLAGDRDTTFTGIEQIFAGHSEVITDSAPALAAVQQYQLCVLLPTGVTPFVPATHTTQAPDKLVIAHIAVATVGQPVPYWSKGKFNHELVIWPAGVTTFAARKELVQGSMLQVGHLI